MSPRTRRHPLPRVRVQTRPALPGGALRVAAGAATAALLLLAVAHLAPAPDLRWLLTALALLLGTAATLQPGHRPALAAVALTAVVMVSTSGPQAELAGLYLAPLAYVAVRLSAWAAALGWTARVELAALGRSAARDTLVLAATLAVGGLALALRGHALPALLAAGAAGLLGVAWLSLRTEDGVTADPQRTRRP